MPERSLGEFLSMYILKNLIKQKPWIKLEYWTPWNSITINVSKVAWGCALMVAGILRERELETLAAQGVSAFSCPSSPKPLYHLPFHFLLPSYLSNHCTAYLSAFYFPVPLNPHYTTCLYTFYFLFHLNSLYIISFKFFLPFFIFLETLLRT